MMDGQLQVKTEIEELQHFLSAPEAWKKVTECSAVSDKSFQIIILVSFHKVMMT